MTLEDELRWEFKWDRHSVSADSIKPISDALAGTGIPVTRREVVRYGLLVDAVVLVSLFYLRGPLKQGVAWGIRAIGDVLVKSCEKDLPQIYKELLPGLVYVMERNTGEKGFQVVLELCVGTVLLRGTIQGEKGKESDLITSALGKTAEAIGLWTSLAQDYSEPEKIEEIRIKYDTGLNAWVPICVVTGDGVYEASKV